MLFRSLPQIEQTGATIGAVFNFVQTVIRPDED